MSNSNSTRHLGQRLTGLLATLGALCIVVGLPVLFVAIGAAPAPDRLPTIDGVKNALLAPDDGTLVLSLLKIVGWVAWAAMTLSLAVEFIARLRHIEAPEIPGLRVPQAGARSIVGMAALLFVAMPIATQVVSVEHAGALPAPNVSAAAYGPDLAHDQPAPAVEVSARRTLESDRQTVDHTVQPGESLWAIAEAQLGDGRRYQEIVALNRALLGAQPGFLEPGWVLRLPAPPATGAPPHSYTVKRADTLSGIAQRELGDPGRWPEIYAASTGISQPRGAHLTDPDAIDVGWTLHIPGDSTVPIGPEIGADDRASHGHDDPTGAERPDVAQPRAEPSADAEPPGAETPETLAPDVAPPASEDSVLDAPWLLAGLSGAGTLLAGALLIGVRAHRRIGRRNRRPGRTIAAPSPELAPVEMTVNTTGAGAIGTVEYADEALRRLAAEVGAAGASMPPLAALELSAGRITLHLSAPAEVPAPWEGTPDRVHWHLSTDTAVDDLGPTTDDVESPYPLLVTIGATDTGETWLLNCEELSSIIIDGDPTYARDLARHLVAQLAVNPWSRRVLVDCVGVAEEVAAMDERIAYHPSGADGTSATDRIAAAASTTIGRAARYGTDVCTARAGAIDDDTWPARMLVLDEVAGEPDGLDQLVQLVADHAGSSATSIVIVGHRPYTAGVPLHMTSTGRVVLEQSGLNLIAVGLTSDEAHGCAQLYAQSEIAADARYQVDEMATTGWEAYTDQSGALRDEWTLPRGSDGGTQAEPSSALLTGHDDDYVRLSPILREELETLAPQVRPEVRAEVEESDAELDQDIADWFSPNCRRPRLSLLGVVSARAHGKALAKRKPYFTELLSYLALHRRTGATRDELCDAFGITHGKVRDYINILRDWVCCTDR